MCSRLPHIIRYNPEVGDLVVGRISEVCVLSSNAGELFFLSNVIRHRNVSISKVGPKRWKVELNARLDGVLMLSSVNLPGGIQVNFFSKTHSTNILLIILYFYYYF